MKFLKIIGFQFIIVALFFLCCCKGKEGMTVVNGTVTDMNNKIIINQPVTINAYDREFGLTMGLANKITSANTDQEGKFSFAFEADKGYYYMVETPLTKCYFGKSEKVSSSSNNTIVIKLGLKGYMILKTNSNLIGDSISYVFLNQLRKTIGSSYHKILVTDYISSGNLNEFSVPANENTFLKWLIYTKGNTVIEDSITLLTNQCDTLVYEIKK